MIRSLVFFAFFLAFSVASVCGSAKCWMASTEKNGTFPASQALKLNASTHPEEMTACAKIYIIRTDGSPIPFQIFNWQEWEIEKMSDFVKCGDIYEYSVAAVFRDYGAYYYRVCTCCGDYCNDGSMDDKCNDYPAFTARCHSTNHIQPDASKDPRQNEKAVFETAITATQKCFKGTSTDGKDRYLWGGATFPECGKSYSYHETHASYRACTCCGDRCNDGRMDNVLIADKDCSGKHDSATTASLSFAAVIFSLIAYILP